MTGLTLAPSQLATINLTVSWFDGYFGPSQTPCVVGNGGGGVLVAQTKPSGVPASLTSSVVPHNGIFNGNLTISSGQTYIINGTVTGNVTQNGGALFASNATIGGNLHYRWRHLLNCRNCCQRRPPDPEHSGWLGTRPDLRGEREG